MPSRPEPRGLADAFLVGREFIGGRAGLPDPGRQHLLRARACQSTLRKAAQLDQGALIFAYPVRDPERYGVVEFDEAGKALQHRGKTRTAALPLRRARDLFLRQPGGRISLPASNLPQRGELEITDLNRIYLERGQLRVEVLGRGVAWLDAGTHESLLQAANFVQAVEERQGMMISCPEEIAYRMGYHRQSQLRRLARVMDSNQYGQYLLRLLKETFLPGIGLVTPISWCVRRGSTHHEIGTPRIITQVLNQ